MGKHCHGAHSDELCSRAISGTFEQVHFFLPKMATNGLGNLWKLPMLARNELAKNGNLCERPDLKMAKSGHSYKSPFMVISRNCHFWLVKVPLRQLPKLPVVALSPTGQMTRTGGKVFFI